MYDFGKSGNQEHYGQDTPPIYNMDKVTAPVACYWSENDWMAAPEVFYLKVIEFELDDQKV